MQAEAKKKTVVYLPPEIDRRLWDNRIATRIPVTRQVENIIRQHFARVDRANKSKPLAGAAS